MKNLNIFFGMLVLLFIAGCTSQTSSDIGGNIDSNVVNKDINSVDLAALQIHNSQDDCWVAYDSKVYDITDFLKKHPGGADTIIPYCGTSDGFIKAFEGKHGMSKVNVLEKEGIFIGDFNNS